MFKLKFLEDHNHFVRKHTLEHKGDFLFLHEKISAKKTFERETVEMLILIILAFIGVSLAIILSAGITVFWVIFFSAALLFYLTSLIFKVYLTIVSVVKKVPLPSYEDIHRISDKDLPPYTVLVPLYKEGEVLKEFVEHFGKMDYPKDKLDVRLLLEEDDEETLKVARQLKLTPPFSVVIIPQAGPRTKPKALNVGVIDSESEILTIYDAEDKPDFDQLRKIAWAFDNLPKNIVCIQAKLTFYNDHQNILTKWFTAEYHSWFNHFLPALYHLSFPIPLGGTSNHFKTSVLKEIGGWDPYNVTEDADLGIRISRLGYKISMIESSSAKRATSEFHSRSSIAIIESLTQEEANSMFLNWFRQRTRWIKGYIQTAIVHLRHPKKAFKDLSIKGFFSFLFFVIGTPFTHLLNLVFWSLTIAWIVGFYTLPFGVPKFIYWGGLISLFVGNTIFILLHVIPMLFRKKWKIAFVSLFIPIYWFMMSIATIRGIFQLIFRPHYWDKTSHGLALRSSFAQNVLGVFLIMLFVSFGVFGVVKIYNYNSQINSSSYPDSLEVGIEAIDVQSAQLSDVQLAQGEKSEALNLENNDIFADSISLWDRRIAENGDSIWSVYVNYFSESGDIAYSNQLINRLKDATVVKNNILDSNHFLLLGKEYLFLSKEAVIANKDLIFKEGADIGSILYISDLGVNSDQDHQFSAIGMLPLR